MKKLYIPEHISLGNEYLPGIGRKELRQLLAAAIPGLVIAVLVWINADQPGTKLLTMICCIGYLVFCCAFFAKVDGNQSMYSFVARIIRFSRSQKHYYYREEEETLYHAETNKQP